MEKDKLSFLIISDSHSREDNVSEVFKKYSHMFDAAIFLGDGLRDLDVIDGRAYGMPIYCVRGNCDGFFGAYTDVPTELTLNFFGKRLLLTHGHRFDVKYGLSTLASYAALNGYDAVLFGHTHEPEEVLVTAKDADGNDKTVALFNPGSIGGSYAMRGTFGTLTLSEQGMLFGYGSI